MARKNQEAFSQMYLANALEGEVQAWVEQGWPGVTQTTLELFNYWFKRDEETTERFHPCQQRAIETLIYCHEILQAKTLKELFERVVSEALYQHLPLQQEVETILFPKYALKMATGSGKTWVLAALLVWQYIYDYDYDLLNAMQDMLVKQLFLEQRQAIGGESLEELDFRADRHEPEGSHRRGEIKALSAGQKLLLDIGRKKLEQLTVDFDFLFVVEHPRFIGFYNKLKQQGYVFGSGDTSKETSTGDIIPVDAMTERIPLFDIAWPIQVFDEGKLPELSQIDIRRLSPYRDDFHQLKKYLSKLIVQETHVQTGVKTKAWKLDNEYFDYSHFLRQASRAVAIRGKTSILSAKQAEIAELIDSYVSEYCFREQIDFTNPENYQVLNYQPVFDYIVEVISRAIIKLIEGYKFEVKKGIWGKLSDVPRIMLRESKSAVTERSIYPRAQR